jgi:hypothetical protein
MRSSPKLLRLALLTLAAVLAVTGAANAATLRAPKPVSPANGARVQQLPAISWNAVRSAAEYEYQVAADPRFNSLALGKGPGNGASRTHNLAATLSKTVPDGTYYWHVRGVTTKDKVGAWSRVRKIFKRWTTAPLLTGGDGSAIAWPTTPLVLRWSSVAYATKYIVSVATDPALSNIVVGSTKKPQETQGTNFALPVSLAPGAYYWAVTPLDAEGHRGARSAVGSFHWTWPTTTTTSVTDLNPDPAVFDPLFSWTPVAGTAHYEVEVNAAEGFPTGSKWCCSGTTTGTSLAPLLVLANNAYYWRVRAVDARGNAGVWNSGAQFTKAFDSVTPSIANLTVRDANGNALGGVPETDTPIVTWQPVPGASRYQVQLAPYGEVGCDWSAVGKDPGLYQADTASTAWTPLGTAGRIGPTAWPSPEKSAVLPTGRQYCLRVLARSDDDAQRGQVVSEWTQINGAGQPAFTYAAPPPPGPPEKPFRTQAGAYLQPTSGTLTPRTPLFTWNRVAGANGYYVVIARDAGFTQVATIGFTNVPAYAPRLANDAPLSDETTAYYWAVIPSTDSDGGGVSDDVPQDNSPQSFNKSSAPPALIGPVNGAQISNQPTFRWSSAENARNYRLQVSQDPTFGNPIDDVTTDATAYTSSSTYPADTAIYWRVRANDWKGQGLNWSPTQTFVRRLPVPSPAADNATSGHGIPSFSWAPVQGAISYDVHVEQPDGTKRDFNFESPVFTVVKYYGTGIWRWQVRGEFPTASGGTVAGGYSAPQPFLLTLAPPRGARGARSGSRILISWNAEPDAKQYQIEVSTTNGFRRRIASGRIDGTSWAPDIDLGKKQNRGTLYWRVAAVDAGGNVGSFASGVFGGSHTRRCPSSRSGKKGRANKTPHCVAPKRKIKAKRHG